MFIQRLSIQNAALDSVSERMKFALSGWYLVAHVRNAQIVQELLILEDLHQLLYVLEVCWPSPALRLTILSGLIDGDDLLTAPLPAVLGERFVQGPLSGDELCQLLVTKR
jgi:hypothetical protein